MGGDDGAPLNVRELPSEVSNSTGWRYKESRA
jgi:hypothetical protein